jgi:hypothetical protein
MTRVLWDTDVISYWLIDEPRFRLGIQKALTTFGEGRSFYVSTLSTQELMVWARLSGRADATYAFIAEHFTPLDFTEPCAVEAARLLLAVHGPRADSLDVTPDMHRDAALVATANSHQLDVLFTGAESSFARFKNHVSCKLVSPATTR